MALRSAMIFTYLAAIVMGARAASLRSSSSLKADACSCLNWKKTYASTMVECGQANEYFLSTHKHATTSLERLSLYANLGGEFCDRFYMTLDDNFCVNVNMGEDDGEWCYVSRECTDATPVPGAALSWKQCSAQDQRRGDLAPTTLAAFASDNDLDLGLLHKMSYPVHKDHLWGDVEAYWGLGNGTADPMPFWVRNRMKKIADAGTPYSFDTAEDKHPPHRIVVGKSVYAVNPSGQDPQDPEHPGSWDKLECLTGCGQ